MLGPKPLTDSKPVQFSFITKVKKKKKRHKEALHLITDNAKQKRKGKNNHHHEIQSFPKKEENCQ